MFGHGQIEGYTEKYGMEYRRAYYDESPDQWLVARHEREISPLLHRRALFARNTLVGNYRGSKRCQLVEQWREMGGIEVLLLREMKGADGQYLGALPRDWRPHAEGRRLANRLNGQQCG